MGTVKRLPAVLLISLIFFLAVAIIMAAPVAVMTINTGLITIIAGILLLVICMILLFALLLAYGQAFFIAITRPSVRNPISHSAKITKGKRWKILLSYFLLCLIIIAAEFLMMIPFFIFSALSAFFMPLIIFAVIIWAVFVIGINIYTNAFYFALFRALEDSYGQKGQEAQAEKYKTEA